MARMTRRIWTTSEDDEDEEDLDEDDEEDLDEDDEDTTLSERELTERELHQTAIALAEHAGKDWDTLDSDARGAYMILAEKAVSRSSGRDSDAAGMRLSEQERGERVLHQTAIELAEHAGKNWDALDGDARGAYMVLAEKRLTRHPYGGR